MATATDMASIVITLSIVFLLSASSSSNSSSSVIPYNPCFVGSSQESTIASASDLNTEVTRAKAAEDKIEASVGLATNGSHVPTSGHYTSEATTIAGEISALDTQVKKNADAIGTVKGYTVNEKAIDTNPVLNGGDIKLTGYSPDANGDLFAEGNTINAAMKIIMQQLVWHEA